MYENSLFMYLEVFNLTLETSKKDDNLDARLRNVVEALTYDVYNFTCLGLFERHKLMLSFQLTIKIQEGEDALNREQLDFFLKGNLSLEKSERKKPHEWWPDQGWEDIMALINLAATIPTPSGEFPEEGEQVNRAPKSPCPTTSTPAAVDDSVRALVQAAIEAVTAEETDPEVEPEVEPEAEPEAEEQTPVDAEASEEKRRRLRRRRGSHRTRRTARRGASGTTWRRRSRRRSPAVSPRR